MKAWRLHEPGGPNAFALEELPAPEPEPGRVLIKVHAFGLNRSEWFTRIGESPTVKLPRVLGIECVGTVVSAPTSELDEGQRVAAMMGGMGRQFDGSYAEYTSVPAANVFPLRTDLPWDVLGALPEMLQTCHGSLHVGLSVQAGDTLLIRGGTSSIGLATLAMAKVAGLRVLSTSRSEAKADALRKAGADDVVIDDGELGPKIRRDHPDGLDRVLELIGTTTLLDSLQCVRSGGGGVHDRYPGRGVGDPLVSTDGAHPNRGAADLVLGRRERHLARRAPALRLDGRARRALDPHRPRVELRPAPARSSSDG